MTEQKYWDNEKIPGIGDRVMTDKTLRHLQQVREKAQDELIELGSVTESGHQRAQMHDNATLEEYKNELRGRIKMIGDLSGAMIIRSRQETNCVMLGNKVTLLIEGEKVPERFTLLGPDDVGVGLLNLAPQSLVISYRSPLGAAVIGKKIGDDVYYMLRSKKVGIQLIEIGPGGF